MTRAAPILLVLPACLMLGALALYPTLFGAWASFHQWDWSRGQADHWVFNGLSNYLLVVTDARFRNSILVTIYFAALAVTIEMVVGLALALLLSSRIRGAWFFRSAIVFPLMVSDIVAGVIFATMLEPTLGPVNYFLSLLHLPTPNWTGGQSVVVPMLALVDAWWQTGNIVLILLAGLTSIPPERTEMAAIDGARGWSMLRHILLPGLQPFILVALIFRTIDALRVFALPWAITKGGPNRASDMAQLYIFRESLGQYFDMGYASAAAIIFSILISLISGVYLMLMRRPSRH